MKFSKPLAIALGLAIAAAPIATAGAQAATRIPGIHAAAGDATSTDPSFTDALTAFNAANAALAATLADPNSTNTQKQQAFQAARQAFNDLTRAAQAGRKAADKIFQTAVKAAKDAFKLAMSLPVITADAKLAATNLLNATLTAAATARDTAYRALALPNPPAAPVLAPKPGKTPKPGSTEPPASSGGALGNNPKKPNN